MIWCWFWLVGVFGFVWFPLCLLRWTLLAVFRLFVICLRMLVSSHAEFDI